MTIRRYLQPHIFGFFLAMMIPVTGNAAEIFYDWVPDAGSGGSGFIRFADTNIADPENFEVRFDTDNVLEVSFIFDSGFDIEDAVDFAGASTLQDSSNLGDLLYEADNGIIDGWSFEYINAVVILPQSNFVDVATTGLVCFTAPCPAFTADLEFIGHLASEFNQGSWQLRSAVVPVPAALPLFLSGLVFIGLLKNRHSNMIEKYK